MQYLHFIGNTLLYLHHTVPKVIWFTAYAEAYNNNYKTVLALNPMSFLDQPRLHKVIIHIVKKNKLNKVDC